jgi:hypothetical protein
MLLAVTDFLASIVCHRQGMKQKHFSALICVDLIVQ